MDQTKSCEPILDEHDVPAFVHRPSKILFSDDACYLPQKGLVRYSTALKHLIPVRGIKSKRDKIAVDNAGLLSLITFSWMSPYIWAAYRKGFTRNDIPEGSPYDECNRNSRRLEVLWEKEVAEKGPANASFSRVVWLFARTRLLVACVGFSLSCIFGFLSATIFMRKLLEYCEAEDATVESGIAWAFLLAFSELSRSLTFSLCWSVGYRTACRLRAACLTYLYRKLLKHHSLGDKSVGEIINLFSNDGTRLFHMIVFSPMILGGPMVAICGTIFILQILGGWALFGMVAFFVIYPIQFGLSRLNGYYRGKMLLCTDKRVTFMSELVASIKLIKMYVLEKVFARIVIGKRKEELSSLKKTLYCQSLSTTMAPTVPAISGIVTFLAHVLAGGNLTASKAFPVLAFSSKQLRMALKHLQESVVSIQDGFIAMPRFKAFPLVTILGTQLRTALLNFWYSTDNIIGGNISLSRIQEILLKDESKVLIEHPIEDDVALSMLNGTFVSDNFQFHTVPSRGKLSLWKKWKKSNSDNHKEDKQLLNHHEETVELLKNVSLTVKKGALIGICGPVGSGKSSLLLACLGQLKMVNGKLCRHGSVAFVSQQSWIQNETFKENVLFGENFDPKRFIYAIHACALNEDLNLLPGGDETMIGEKGVTLSGGQKQRVALARALYANRDLYFLDDPLSAVDTEVSTHIFESCILTALKDKTVLMVSHNVSHLQKCDEILVMKGGRIVERGSHNTLLQFGREYSLIVQAAEFSNVNLNAEPQEEVVEQPNEKLTQVVDTTEETTEKKKIPTQLIKEEKQIQGEVKSYAYKAYVNAAGGYFVAFVVIMAIFVNVGSNAFSSFWLAYWIKQGGGVNITETLGDGTNDTTSFINITMSNNINDNPDLYYYLSVYAGMIGIIVITSVIRSVIYTGVTVRATSKLHNSLLSRLLKCPLNYFETTPTGRIQNLFARDLDEIDSRLPVMMETMLQNIWTLLFAFLFITLVFPWFCIPLIFLTILYYYVSKIFRVAVRDLQRLDNITRAPVFSHVSETIFGLSTIHAFNKEAHFNERFFKIFNENSTCLFLSCNAMRWMATRLDTISVIIACITALLAVSLKNQVPAALAGLALTYAAHISGVFQYTIRLMSETEAKFISVERIQDTIQNFQVEGNATDQKPPEDWPSKGSIRFKNVVFSYGEDQPDILHDVSFSIKAGEKIGVVGRTGAGKTSVITALLRLTEISRGCITIDGVDISTIGLAYLRNAMAVIPQDPILFSGTLRHNLDPFEQHSDESIWEVLRKTRLEQKVLSFEGGLNAAISFGGDNLSVGERQLICLARALLRRCKILLLDEATASVDPETEHAIQTTINEEFGDCTLLSIAHKLSTVTSLDRVMVLNKGKIVEMDNPSTLLADKSSALAKLAAAVGFIPNH